MLQEDHSLFLPDCVQLDSFKSSEGSISPKGSHGLSVVHKMLSNSALWKQSRTKALTNFQEYILQSKMMQCLYYTPDCIKLPQCAPGKPHFIWDDIHISKGKLNKDRQIDVDIDGEKVQSIYRLSPC